MALLELYKRLPTTVRIRLRSIIPGKVRRWFIHKRVEVYLISYPKCGRTWLRLMIGKALALYFSLPEGEDVLLLNDLSTRHPNIPVIKVEHEDHPMHKTPQELQTSKEHFRDKKVIFLVRDPRDVIISSYFEFKKRAVLFGASSAKNQSPLTTSELSEFIFQPRGGFDTILKYYNIWAENRHVPKDFLLVRYEDVHRSPEAELQRVLNFLGLHEVPQDIVRAAVQYASFENMRRMEAEGRFESSMLKPGDQKDEESYKTRRGEISGYKRYLKDSEIEVLNQKMRTQLSSFFGYQV